MKQLRSIAVLVATVAVVALAGFAAPAGAAGGSYVFDGGTAAQQATVRNALRASLFPWSIVPRTITIHIVDGGDSYARPGEVWLDGDLLRAGRFSWGVVQHEYAHQVDFFLFNDATRTSLTSLLGARDWCFELPALRHDQHGCERFASTLAWSYWPVPENCMRPSAATDESAAMAPAAFRALMARVLNKPQPLLMRVVRR